jgi:oligosaccharide repeat unit polymerase
VGIILFAYLIIGHQLALFLARRRFNPFDVFTLIDIVLLTMWVYVPLVNESLYFRFESDFSFFITTFLGIVFLYIGLHLPIRKTVKDTQLLFSIDSSLRVKWLIVSLILFCGATIIFMYQQLYFSRVSIWEYLKGERLSIYMVLLNEQNRGSIPDAIISFTRPILLVWLAISLERRQWLLAVFLYLIIFIGIVAISVTRLQIIITLLIPLFYYNYIFRYRISIPSAILTAIIFIILIYVLNIWRTQGFEKLIDVDVGLIPALEELSVNFKPLEGYEILWQLYINNRLQYEYGLTYLYIFLTAVPRILWLDKPLVSHEARWTTYLFGQHFAMVSEGTGVWTFTVWGEGLTQFGILGVFLNLFLFGLLVRWMYNKFNYNPHFKLMWFYYSIISAIYLRSSFSALAWIFLPLVFTRYVYLHGVIQLSRNVKVF